ncbi:MAG: macro domain-containing protein [Anaerolineaceae bacterium]
MVYQEIKGNLFNSKAQAYVNTVNCVGAMGKGIALEFRRRYPDMFEQYKKDCLQKKLVPGRIYSYPQPDVLILNFAIKNDWKQPSKVEWVESTLKQFVAWYRNKEIKSVAFPWMGAMNGGIPFEIIQSLTRNYLQNLPDIDIEVYTFDPVAPDPLFEVLKKITSSDSALPRLANSGIKLSACQAVILQVNNGSVKGLSRFAENKTLGKTSMDKLYVYLTAYRKNMGAWPEKSTGEETIQYPLF